VLQAKPVHVCTLFRSQLLSPQELVELTWVLHHREQKCECCQPQGRFLGGPDVVRAGNCQRSPETAQIWTLVGLSVGLKLC
jgi:hypothetical protein